jgi:hypothetical protein
MDVISTIPLISATLVLFALSYGSWMDIHYRKFPKWIWSFVAPPAAITTLFWYGTTIYENGLNAILAPFLTSVILCLLCFIMAHRMGNGGDWRALFYISLLTPWFAPLTLILSCVFGIIQVTIDWLRKSPIKSAWTVSITLAFVVACITKVFML